jgi:CheY-like chemotaxis protein
MAIVRHLVELHGGTVRADSAGENQGATFTIVLPMWVDVSRPTQVEADDTASDAEVRLEDLPRLDGISILVVDDDSDSRNYVCQLLENQGADLSGAESTAEAFERFVRLRPDVLISDIAMPGEDGYALIRRVRALSEGEGGNTPAVALTAYVRNQDEDAALMAGYDRHIRKPVVIAELIQAVAELANTKAIPAD